MSYRTPDLYFQPEQFGLTQVAELEDPEECYSFDTLVLWQHEDGRLFYASDVGCSCPSPFEDYTSLDDATELTDDPSAWSAFENEVTSHCVEYSTWHRRGQPDPNAADKTAMLAKAAKLLAAQKAITRDADTPASP